MLCTAVWVYPQTLPSGWNSNGAGEGGGGERLKGKVT